MYKVLYKYEIFYYFNEVAWFKNLRIGVYAPAKTTAGKNDVFSTHNKHKGVFFGNVKI